MRLKNEGSLNGVDVCIYFTHTYCIIENIHAVSKLGKSLVVGTTGEYDYKICRRSLLVLGLFTHRIFQLE